MNRAIVIAIALAACAFATTPGYGATITSRWHLDINGPNYALLQIHGDIPSSDSSDWSDPSDPIHIGSWGTYFVSRSLNISPPEGAWKATVEIRYEEFFNSEHTRLATAYDLRVYGWHMVPGGVGDGHTQEAIPGQMLRTYHGDLGGMVVGSIDPD
ncbi:MAG: hypothetical protein ACYTFO_05685, partial [Planctomycetota bacterium]